MPDIERLWCSVAGKAERDATYGPLVAELEERFPDETVREKIRVLIPGVGLGRLGWEIAEKGFDSVANEYSVFMLIGSCFMLNACTQPEQFTIYPNVSSSCNRWSYADRTRAITFPDICPSLTAPTNRDPPMAMATGDFLTSFSGDEGRFNAIVTSWFIDTAHNVIEYIEHINRLLIVGGVWINAGPLTYHYSDTPGELSLELPIEEILRIASQLGFRIDKQRSMESLYAGDSSSMLKYSYDVSFFVAVKEEDVDANH